MASRFGRKKRAKMRAEIEQFRGHILMLTHENSFLSDRAISHAKAYSDLAERVHAGMEMGIRCEPDGPDWVYSISRATVQECVARGTVKWLAQQIAAKFEERMVKEIGR